MSADLSEYRIEFVIQRQRPGKDDDFTEIGFGSSGSWSDLRAAVYAISSVIDNYEWETERGQPDPEDIRAELEGS